MDPDQATFANTVLPLAQNEDRISLESNIIGFYQFVGADIELRTASRQAKLILDDFQIESATRAALFQRVDVVLNKKEDIGPESQRLLEKEHRKYISNGLSRPLAHEPGRCGKWDAKRRRQSICHISVS